MRCSQSPTFGRLEEADAGLDLGPVLPLLLGGVLHHQLVELHRDDVMVVWGGGRKEGQEDGGGVIGERNI